MSHFNFYPHFVADQVLTANHLNELFNYLDDQERLTRNHLIGIGVVCGLELTCSNGQITISKGCGVTSDGYLIIHGGETYTHYHDYRISNDLKTTTPYDQFNAPAALELVSTAKKINTDIALNGAVINRQDYAVVLLLEKKTTDLKNCTTNDCDDKGEKVEMNLKPLLVLKSKLTSFAYFGYETLKMNLPEIPLKRFNVPFQQMTTPSDVLSSFLTITDFATLQSIETAYSGAYTAFKIILPDNSDPFLNLRNLLSAKINSVKNNSPVHIQYCYDFIDDLIKAYAEFRDKGMDVITECCPDESAFRYHLMLGDSNISTAAGNSSYRQGFIYSPIFNGQKDKAKEVQMIFQRMKLLVSDFAGDNLNKFKAKGIRITPSQWGKSVLSDRAIPYHYDPDALYKVWNYKLTRKGRSTRNLSYHSDAYSAPQDVQLPLKYDIEPYNFFRIEGHIGIQYKLAFAELLKQKAANNLPIDIIALNMRADEGNITVDDLTCFFQDLDSQYNVLISELMCKVHHPVCFISKLPYTAIQTPPGGGGIFNLKEEEAVEEKKLIVRLNEARLKSRIAPVLGDKKENTAADSLVEMLDDIRQKQENVNAVGKKRAPIILDAFTSEEAVGFIDTVRAKGTYTRGTFLKEHCAPVAGTIGFEYLNRVKKGSNFPDPGGLPGSNDPNVVLAYFYKLYFYFIDSADKMIGAILPYDLGELDMEKFQTQYETFIQACWELSNALILFIAVMDAQTTRDDKTPNQITDDIFDAWISFVVSEVQIMSHLCIDDRLQTLKEEYAKRIEKIIQHRLFSQYSKDHTGIEHKAGVPKGGTFILVYAKGAVVSQQENNEEIVIEASAKKVATIGVAEKGAAIAKEEKLALLAEKQIGQAKNDKQRQLFTLRQQFQKVKTDQKEVFTKEENDAFAAIEKVLGSQAFIGEAFNIPNGVVFADFYLPYLCCSDCAPINYVIEESKPDPVQPTIGIIPAEFCNQDDKSYPITTTPGGGSLTKVPGVDEVNFTFSPFGLSEGTVTITYTKDGLSAAASCQIFAPKSAEFTLNSSVDAAGVFTVTIVPAVTGGSHEWFLDDAVTPFSIKPTPDPLTFTLQGANQTIKIAHTVKNGPCTSVPVSHTIVLQKAVSNVTDAPIIACFAQNIPMAVLSAGTILSVLDNGGLQINAQGFIVFGGPIATPQLTTIVKYTITTASAIVNHTVSVTLFRNFVADFTRIQKELPDGTVELTCTATDAAAPGHKWAVDGVVIAGASTAVFKQIFTFSTPENIVKIKHTVNNGQCVAELEIPVTLKRIIFNDKITAFACAAIRTEQIIDTSLIAGDSILVLDADKTKIKISQVGNTVVAVINPAAFPAATIITVIYKITKGNGQIINRTADIQVGVVDTQFRITALPAVKQFELRALGANIALAEWKIQDANGTVVFNKSGNPVQMPQNLTDTPRSLLILRVTEQFGAKENKCVGQTTLSVNSQLFAKISNTPGGVVFP
jgi:hypothetical protein